MIVCGYSLELYCDHPSHNGRLRDAIFYISKFYHPRKAVCVREARREGWLIKNGKAICPNCRKRRLKATGKEKE